MPKLNDWAIVAVGTPYTAPEAMTAHLVGHIYEDKRFCDGTYIRTSPVASLSLKDEKNRTATTASGTIYSLGTPLPEFIVWLEENGKTLSDYETR